MLLHISSFDYKTCSYNFLGRGWKTSFGLGIVFTAIDLLRLKVDRKILIKNKNELSVYNSIQLKLTT